MRKETTNPIAIQSQEWIVESLLELKLFILYSS